MDEGAEATLREAVMDYHRARPETRLSGGADPLIMPNLDAANVTFNALEVVGGLDRLGMRAASPRP